MITLAFFQNLRKKISPEKKTNIIDLNPIISAKNLALIRDIEIVGFSEKQMTLRLQVKSHLDDKWFLMNKINIQRGLVFEATSCKVKMVKQIKPFIYLTLEPQGKEKLPFGPEYEEWYQKRGKSEDLEKIEITLVPPEYEAGHKSYCLYL